MHNTREPHFSALKRILCYVRDTLDHVLRLISSSTTSLLTYSNVDWAGYPATRRSSLEAEYRDVANAFAETCLGIFYHIEIDIHFVRDLVATCQVRVLHVPLRYEYADIFTKGLPSALFEEFRTSLSIWCPPAPTAGEYMDLFNLIRAPNPTKVKIGSRLHTAHEVPLLTLTANRVVEMEDSATATDSSGVPSTIERSPLDFANEAGASDQGTMAPKVPPPEDVPATSAPKAGHAKKVAATDPFVATKSRKRGRDGADVNAPSKVLRRDHADPRPTGSTTAAGDPDSGNASFASVVRSSESGDGVTAAPDVRTRGKAVEEVCCSNMKKAAEDRSAGLSQELEDMRSRFSDLQVSNERLSHQVATLQEQVSREEKLKAAFEEFKRYEDSRVEQRCTEMDARLDALSIDFDKELYPHMLTAIAELRQAFADVVSAGIAKGMSEGLRHRALKDLKYPLVDQLEGLKDAPMDVIMAVLYLESDTGDDSPQHVSDLRPSSSQLTIPVYPKVRDPMNPWACKEEILLADAIAANISRAEKKKIPHSMPYSWGRLRASLPV
nr:ribonuclease H-like domain-containing protein [Tanacetum cinerariifolium]